MFQAPEAEVQKSSAQYLLALAPRPSSLRCDFFCPNGIKRNLKTHQKKKEKKTLFHCLFFSFTDKLGPWGLGHKTRVTSYHWKRCGFCTLFPWSLAAWHHLTRLTWRKESRNFSAGGWISAIWSDRIASGTRWYKLLNFQTFFPVI